MGYLHNFLYLITPKTLLTRFILIICIPIIACQIIALYVFYERHWSNVSQQISKVISNEIRLVLREYKKHNYETSANYASSFRFKFDEVEKLPKFDIKRFRSEISTFEEMLKDSFSEFQFLLFDRKKGKITIYFDVNENNFLRFIIPAKPIINPTSEVFVVWVISMSIIFIIISLIFAKNQIRSIEELSEAADSYGKGIFGDGDFKPSGALEIRQAGFALKKMRERILRQAKKRLQMLAIISHDLRTPLTRMLLQLELMDKSKEIDLLKSDVDSMKHMIDSYLDFARGEGAEKFEKIDFGNWLKDFFEHSRFSNAKLIENNTKIFAGLKPLSFMRALANLISNAEKYSTYSELSWSSKNDNIEIIIEDNGPGIKDGEKEHVLKAFYRSDKARKIDKHGSVGLGLPIAKEIILDHKGSISIIDSEKLGGTKLIVKIPILREIGEDSE